MVASATAALNNASAAVQWNVLRRHSAFLHKRRGIRTPFSSEKFNLTGKYTTRSSGLGGDSGVSVALSADKKTLVVETKNKSQGAQHTPAKAITTTIHKGSPKAVIKSVGKQVKAYEPALAHKAQKRASQLLRSLQVRKQKKNKSA